MAMAASGTKIVPESSSKLMGGLNISILPSDCEEGEYGAGHPQSSGDSLSSRATRAAKEASMHCVDLKSDSDSSSTCSHKGKLPMVLEESESLSHRDGDISSSSSLSSVASSAASTLAFLHRDGVRKPKKPRKLPKRKDCKETSLLSLLLWPLKKVRDGYMSCIMGLDEAGDLSALVQGSSYAPSSKYFADLPLPKTDQ